MIRGRQPALPLGSGAYPAFSRPRNISLIASAWPQLLRRVGRRRAACLALAAFTLVAVAASWRAGSKPPAASTFTEENSIAAVRTTHEDAEFEQECRHFRPRLGKSGQFTIAIVGELPLTEAYRAELRGMNLTVGVDSLRSLRPGDRLTTWVIQAAQPASSSLEAADAADWSIIEKARHSLQSIMLVGGQSGSMPALQAKLGGSDPEVTHFPGNSWYTSNWLRLPASGRPTTGHLAISSALRCKTPGAMVHLYGFPYRKSLALAERDMAASQHADAEAAIFMSWLRTGKKLTVHEAVTQPKVTAAAAGAAAQSAAASATLAGSSA